MDNEPGREYSSGGEFVLRNSRRRYFGISEHHVREFPVERPKVPSDLG
jgi:hypothetical protein